MSLIKRIFAITSWIFWTVRPCIGPFASDTWGRAVTYPLPCWKCKYPGPLPTEAKWTCAECGMICFRDTCEYLNLLKRGYFHSYKTTSDETTKRAMFGYEEGKRLHALARKPQKKS